MAGDTVFTQRPTKGEIRANTVCGTPAPGCLACSEKRRHTEEDWRYHPGAGTGHYNAAGQPKESTA